MCIGSSDFVQARELTHVCFSFPQHPFFKVSEPLRTLAPLIRAAREIAKSK